jgi:hypothetical protein
MSRIYITGAKHNPNEDNTFFVVELDKKPCILVSITSKYDSDREVRSTEISVTGLPKGGRHPYTNDAVLAAAVIQKLEELAPGKDPSAFDIPILLPLFVCEFEPAPDIEEDRCPDCPARNAL